MRGLRFLLQVSLVVLIAILIAGSAMVWYFNQELPSVESLRNIQMQVPLRVYTADGKLLAEFGEMRRQPVPLSEIPLPLQEAVIATEDQRFYEHSGVDFRGLVRAGFEVWQSGRKVQGGSTITMQVARNFFLNRKKTYTRKIKEILLALKIGREFSKDKVLELYLNQVYFGKRAYGVVAAAQIYYGEPLNKLTIAQMAMLAGLPQAPSSLNPVNNPAAALERRNHVLGRMLEQRYITPAQYDSAIAEPITTKFNQAVVALNAPYIAEMVRDAMVKQYGDSAYTMGLTVYTTINSQDQRLANVAVEEGLLDYDKRHGYRGAIANWGAVDAIEYPALVKRLKMYETLADLQPAVVVSVAAQSAQVLLASNKVVTIPWQGLAWARQQFQEGKWVGAEPTKASDVVKDGDLVYVQPQKNNEWWLTQLPEAEGALISLNPQNGAIYAVVGGFNFQRSKFNRVTSALRQPGSGFKPFIYSAALNEGYTLATLINDAPIVQDDPTSNDLWRPKNDNLVFNGPTRLRVGLMQSRNLVTIRLLQQLGVQNTITYLKRFGFDEQALPEGLSLALGAGVVTPMQMAQSLATFANGGYLITPYFIEKVLNEKGDVLFQAEPPVACAQCDDAKTAPANVAPRVITAQNAYLINSAMKSVITDGTGKAVLALRRSDLAGKTGTTNDYTNNWFSGFNTQMLTVVWLGFDQPRSTFEYGAAAAIPMWLDYMRGALRGMPLADLPRPPGIVTMRINAKTGEATGANDPDAIFEIFSQDHVPQENQPTTTPASSVGQDIPAEPANNQPLF